MNRSIAHTYLYSSCYHCQQKHSFSLKVRHAVFFRGEALKINHHFCFTEKFCSLQACPPGGATSNGSQVRPHMQGSQQQTAPKGIETHFFVVTIYGDDCHGRVIIISISNHQSRPHRSRALSKIITQKGYELRIPAPAPISRQDTSPVTLAKRAYT